VTLSVYRDQSGGVALWQETQNVAVDAEGTYSILMGATQNDGVPMDLLSAGEPRWLGVQVNRPGEIEQPRVLMASVPYALKSVDAETLGGKPASAYLLAGASSSGITASAGTASSGASSATAATSTTAMTNTTAVKPRTISGQQGFVPVFTDGSNDLGDSVIQQSGGFIGFGTAPGANANTTPSLDVRTLPFSQIGMAQTVDYLTFFASDTYGPAIYWDPTKDLRLGKGGNQLYGAFGFVEQMRIQSSTGNVGIGTQAPGSTLDVNGNINFAGVVRYQGTPVLQVPGIQNTAVGLAALANTVSGVGIGGIDTGSFNTAVGTLALNANVGGNSNTAYGVAALQFNTASDNTATGVDALQSNTGGSNNTAVGLGALQLNQNGSHNTAVGSGALLSAGVASSASENTATGYLAGAFNVGFLNTAAGAFALQSAVSGSTGDFNLADGAYALTSNTTGNQNTAAGYTALQANTTGIFNTAVGSGALSSSISTNSNTAVGASAMANTAGSDNTATGFQALQGGPVLSSNSGSNNTADGFQSLYSNTGGYQNTAIGSTALYYNTSGQGNVALGVSALFGNVGGNNNTAIGSGALGQGFGDNNIAIGSAAGELVYGGGDNIHIGNLGANSDSNAIKIGTAGTHTSFYAAGIYGVSPGGVGVVINSSGQLGAPTSSRRYKEDIQNMGDASRGLMDLRPVTFRYKKAAEDGSKPLQYGLIAEEVAEVYPDLVVYNKDGQPDAVQYQNVNAMLLNEVQRQESESIAQKEQIRRLEERLAKLEAALASPVTTPAASSLPGHR